jgi:hypothetical protein
MTWMRLARAVSGMAFAAVLASGPAAANGQAPAAAPGAAQIAGTIRNAADGAPVGRARIVAVAGDAEPRVALSTGDGKYALVDLPAGSYTITVTRTGFAPQTYGQSRTLAGTPVAVTAAQQVTSIDFALVRGGHISGRILDEDGSPFAGATVEALTSRFENGRDSLVSVGSSESDDRGEFRLYGLPPGQYYVSASDPAFRSVATVKGVLRYAPTYYPGVPFADQAKPIVVPATGTAPAIEFKLRILPPAQVSGQIVSHDARELTSGAIIMAPIDGEGVPMVPPEDPSILPDGRFSFGHVVPGHYQIRARGQTEPGGTALFAVFSLEVMGTDIAGIRMTLRPGALIEGILAVESRRGTKPPPLHTLRVRAPFVDGNAFGDALTGTVQPNGGFALRGVMKGTHQITVDGLQPPWVLKEVLYRGGNITDRGLDVNEKEQLRGLRITISDQSSAVSGVVHNTRQLPVANAGVLVFSRVPLFWMRTNRRMRVAYTDSLGRFTVPGLPAGEYLAVASMMVDESDLGRRERLQALQAIATPFRLDSDDSQATMTLIVK